MATQPLYVVGVSTRRFVPLPELGLVEVDDWCEGIPAIINGVRTLRWKDRFLYRVECGSCQSRDLILDPNPPSTNIVLCESCLRVLAGRSLAAEFFE
jgi:ribosomal protein S27E